MGGRGVQTTKQLQRIFLTRLWARGNGCTECMLSCFEIGIRSITYHRLSTFRHSGLAFTLASAWSKVCVCSTLCSCVIAVRGSPGMPGRPTRTSGRINSRNARLTRRKSWQMHAR
jgi:hypothetical protein